MFEDTSVKHDLQNLRVLCVLALGHLWTRCVLKGLRALLGLMAVALSFVQTQLLFLKENFCVILRNPQRTEDQHLRDVAWQKDKVTKEADSSPTKSATCCSPNRPSRGDQF